MAIVPIKPLSTTPASIAPRATIGLSPSQAPVAGASSEGSFGNALNDALSALRDSQATADRQISRLASGEPVELHSAMLAMEQANLTFQFALQVRNKLIEAYQEVTRLQV